MKESLKQNYMPHVDGLRALAVVSVIFFHFAIPGFNGGYIGVDIFFVISGFLITRLIRQEIETTNHFSFLNFYKRRARRLLPALFFVFFVSAIVASFILTPENLAEFGASLISAALSFSNIYFWMQSGYFDTAAHLKPLLHTWSLSVEEQFYLFWPAFIVLIWSIRIRGAKIGLIILLGFISFYLNFYYVNKADPGFNSVIFFLTPFRVFEFAIGALGVFLIGNQRLKIVYQELIAVMGIGLILVSLMVLDSKSIFPYANALIPCLGALLVILAEDSKLIKCIFANKLVVRIGLISYSLYLVHWPFYVFAKYIWLNITSAPFIAVLLLATFISAVFVYRFIEAPFRKADIKVPTFFKTIAVMGVFLCLLGGSMKAYSGWEWRFRQSEISFGNFNVQLPFNLTRGQGKLFFSIEKIEQGKSKRFVDLASACHISALDDVAACDMTKPVQILVFGNSHEPDGFNMLNALYKDDPRVNLILFGTVNDCQLEFKQGQFSSPTVALDCAHRFSILNNEEFLHKITHVFYNAHFAFDYIAKDLWEVMDIVSRKNENIKLISVGSYIATSIDCATLINKSYSFDACKADDVVNYFYPNEHEITILPQAKSMNYLYISKYELLCKNGQLASCLTHVDGEPMFYDQHHLSYAFAKHLGQLMWQRYGDVLVNYGLPTPESKMIVLQ